MKHKSWISLIGSLVLLALAAALAFAMIMAGASVALASHQSEVVAQISPPSIQGPPDENTAPSFSGIITDSRCGARHVRNSDESSSQCARRCVRNGAHYLLIDGDQKYVLTGQHEMLERFAGERVSVTGARQGSRIVVTSVVPFAAP